MNGSVKHLAKGPFLSGVVVLGLVGSPSIEANPAAAQPIGGNTCTPRRVTEEGYIPGHYEGPFFIPGRFVPRQFISTRCNANRIPYNPGNLVQALSGAWFHNGKPTAMTPQQGNSLLLTNEQGQSATGYVEGPRFIFSPQWGVSGHIVDNGSQINWSNGTIWTRSSSGRLLY